VLNTQGEGEGKVEREKDSRARRSERGEKRARVISGKKRSGKIKL